MKDYLDKLKNMTSEEEQELRERFKQFEEDYYKESKERLDYFNKNKEIILEKVSKEDFIDFEQGNDIQSLEEYLLTLKGYVNRGEDNFLTEDDLFLTEERLFDIKGRIYLYQVFSGQGSYSVMEYLPNLNSKNIEKVIEVR